jgi:hypothetical protein
MSSTVQFGEDNGAQIGSPLKGTTRTIPATQGDWKNVDDVLTLYSASMITVGNNSFTKYQFARITGTFTSISNGLWAHTGVAVGANITIKGKVTSAYATPGTAANAALTVDMTTAIAISAGQAVLFSTTGPEDAAPSATLAAAGYTQYLATQLQTAAGASPGVGGPVTFTLQFDET